MLEEEDPTEQVVYYQVASLRLTFEVRNPHVLSSGRDMNLHEQRCAQGGGPRKHLQIVGPRVCFQHRELHKRSFLAFYHARRV